MPAVCRSELMRTLIRLCRSIEGSHVGHGLHEIMLVRVHCIQIQCACAWIIAQGGGAKNAPPPLCTSVYTL
jgi:hypothetical protein